MNTIKKLLGMVAMTSLSACSGALEAAKDAVSAAEENGIDLSVYEGTWEKCEYQEGAGGDLYQAITITADGSITTEFKLYGSGNSSCSTSLMAEFVDTGSVVMVTDDISILNEEDLADGVAESIVGIDVLISSAQVVARDANVLGLLEEDMGIEGAVVDTVYDITSNLNGPGFVPAGSTKFTAIGVHEGSLYFGGTSGENQGFEAETRATEIEGPFQLAADDDEDSAEDSDSDSDSGSASAYLGSEYWGSFKTCEYMAEADVYMSHVFEVGEDGYFAIAYRMHDVMDTTCESAPHAEFIMQGVAYISEDEFSVNAGNFSQEIIDAAVALDIDVTSSHYIPWDAQGAALMQGMLGLESLPEEGVELAVEEDMPGPGFVPAGSTKYTVISLYDGEFYGSSTGGDYQGFSPEFRDNNLKVLPIQQFD